MKFRSLLIFISCSVLVTGVYAGDTQAEKEAKQIEANLNAPIDCRTAEGDIRVLMSEKAHASEQASKGVTSIVPVGLVINVVQGDEDESLSIATGHYDKLIDDKIAQIKKKCPQVK